MERSAIINIVIYFKFVNNFIFYPAANLLRKLYKVQNGFTARTVSQAQLTKKENVKKGEEES